MQIRCTEVVIVLHTSAKGKMELTSAIYGPNLLNFFVRRQMRAPRVSIVSRRICSTATTVSYVPLLLADANPDTISSVVVAVADQIWQRTV